MIKRQEYQLVHQQDHQVRDEPSQLDSFPSRLLSSSTACSPLTPRRENFMAAVGTEKNRLHWLVLFLACLLLFGNYYV
jgi:hypothetical protein